MDICSIFESIDGEVNAFGQGIFTVFVRLAKCNLRCSYCDTTFSFDKGTIMSVDDVVESIESFGIHKVTITGGEPLLQRNEVELLLDKLILKGYNISIETNGSQPVIPEYAFHDNVCWVYDYKLPSSKMQDKMNNSHFVDLRDTDYVKFVINDATDFKEAMRIHRILVNDMNCIANFAYSPVHDVFDPADLVKNLPSDLRDGTFINLQLHKLIWPHCGVDEER